MRAVFAAVFAAFAFVAFAAPVFAPPASAREGGPDASTASRPESPAPAGGPTVDILEVGGPIDRTVAGFLTDAVTSANERGVQVLVIRLDTPGAIGDHLGPVVDAIRASRVPVAVWIGPPGATGVGGGFWLARSAHALALAPASSLGVAMPVDLADPHAGPPLGSVPGPGRGSAFAEEALRGALAVAVREGETGVAVPADVPLPAGTDRSRVRTLDERALAEAGIADFVAGSLPQVLARLDGFEVSVAGPGGAPETRVLDVDPRATSVRFVNMGLVDRILHAVASPTLAYLLLIGGALALAFEVFQPGFGVAGVSGVGVLALGLYGLVVLPTMWLGVALLVLGLLLLAADLALARLGWLTASGTVALAAGSWLMFPDRAGLRPALWLIVAIVALCVLFFVVIMTVVLRAQGNQALAGAQSVVGSLGVVRSVLNPEGHVFVRGALWRARAPESAGKVRTGTTVRVLGMNDQLTLDVEVVPDSGARQEPATQG
jgi:membrane-bound serine protease (ClpP class)